jgi:hypothetical protein
VKILSQTFSWSFNGNVLMMIQVVEKWICVYKPYQLLSIHVIKKHDPLSIRGDSDCPCCVAGLFTLPRQTRTGTTQTRPDSSGFFRVCRLSLSCRCRWVWTRTFKITLPIFSCLICVVSLSVNQPLSLTWERNVLTFRRYKHYISPVTGPNMWH